MWDLIVSVPDHCLSFYFDWLRFRSKRSQPDRFITETLKAIGTASANQYLIHGIGRGVPNDLESRRSRIFSIARPRNNVRFLGLSIESTSRA